MHDIHNYKTIIYKNHCHPKIYVEYPLELKHGKEVI